MPVLPSIKSASLIRGYEKGDFAVFAEGGQNGVFKRFGKHIENLQLHLLAITARATWDDRKKSYRSRFGCLPQ